MPIDKIALIFAIIEGWNCCTDRKRPAFSGSFLVKL